MFFWLHKVQISAWIFTNYFSDFLPFHNDFLTSIFVSEIVLKIIYFYRYSKKFFRKISSLFLNQGSQGNFPDKYVSGGQFWKKCPTGYRACYFSTEYLNVILLLKIHIPKNRCIFAYVQYVERNFKFQPEFRQNCGWIFSF